MILNKRIEISPKFFKALAYFGLISTIYSILWFCADNVASIFFHAHEGMNSNGLIEDLYHLSFFGFLFMPVTASLTLLNTRTRRLLRIFAISASVPIFLFFLVFAAAALT